MPIGGGTPRHMFVARMIALLQSGAADTHRTEAWVAAMLAAPHKQGWHAAAIDGAIHAAWRVRLLVAGLAASNQVGRQPKPQPSVPRNGQPQMGRKIRAQHFSQEEMLISFSMFGFLRAATCFHLSTS